MTIEQAESLFKAYTELLQDTEKRGARRSPSLLPAPKTVLLQAVRMLIAHLHSQALDCQDSLGPLIQAAMFMDSFSDEPVDALHFVTSMQNRRRELIQYYQDLLTIPRGDPFYWQRVYALAGINTETKRTTFFEQLKGRFTRSSRPERPVPATPNSPP